MTASTLVCPSATDFKKAVQQPDKVFTAPELRAATFAKDRWGLPVCGSGANAIVFKATVDGKPVALRFFTRADASERSRYQALNRHITARGLDDCLAASSWHDDAITVRGRRWPLVRMEWIEGRTLDRYVESLVENEDTAALGDLAQLWRTTVKRLQDAEFAHGDLQHANVLVDQSSRLRLVDLDGCWVPALSGSAPPAETGHPNYQRLAPQWDRWRDTFPSLVVYLSLRALAHKPDSWDDLYVGENLLFERGDFATPYGTPVWRTLDTLGDAEVALLARRLRTCCDPRWSATGTLEALLGAGPDPTATTIGTTGTTGVLSGSSAKWWERTGAATVVPPLPTGPVHLPPPPPKAPAPPPLPGRTPWGTGGPSTGTGPIPGPRPAPSAADWWKSPARPGGPSSGGWPTPQPPSPSTPSPSTPSPSAPSAGRTGQYVAWALLAGIVTGVAAALVGTTGTAVAVVAVVAALIMFIALMAGHRK